VLVPLHVRIVLGSFGPRPGRPVPRFEILEHTADVGLRARGATVATGVFGAQMAVASVNDGPFTVLVEV